jgi:uncharacterized heparinase superfamily protein
MTVTKLLVYWHTLRYLKLSQIFGRLKFLYYRPRVDRTFPPSLRESLGVWIEPIVKQQSMYQPDEFCFLNEKHRLLPHQWESAELDRLWLYNLHYFDDLTAQNAAQRADWHLDMMARWVRENPAPSGTGWESYPSSLRIVNWIKWSLAGNTLATDCVGSLAIQVRWLSRRMEYHILGNHLFSNAKALVFAGVFFSGPEADKWLNLGMKILARQIPEQILSDGGHFELSTMYHALVLEDMLDLYNLLASNSLVLTKVQKEHISDWEEIITRMLSWLKAMTHPDQEIGFFNDSAMGISAKPNELQAYSSRLGLEDANENTLSSGWLEASGYARLATGEAVALLDLAPVGPDFLPGHAHADTLSFELSVHGHRVLVNSGTSCYGLSVERLRQRGTAAHNTVEVSRENSSEVWKGFRVARRARVIAPAVIKSSKLTVVTAAHDGYRRLPGRPMHHRRWEWTEHGLKIEDYVTLETIFAEARFHFHPEVKVDIDGGENAGIILLPGGYKIDLVIELGKVHIDPATWHPYFGVSLSNTCLCVELEYGKSSVSLQWN